MLSVKNLKKTYIPKNGQPVSALDDINVDFQEKGLVFILGKSGSGKSTLLNLIGGLDSPTSGEIIIKGKSSKDFKRADFDSYRNTFMGFVFQEYYILEKFTVAQNIGIALELSQEKADLETINQILDAVDLSGYADRMPNELSGGQKQRVAIARAIIKNPRIVLADEPTGSLDSATGEMIFETLKRLSAQRLVIVVSHDRETAERYADRIIELKDGKIIDDVTKADETESGQISQSEQQKPPFVPTTPKTLKLKDCAESDFSIKKSRLPYSVGLKIGASGLKHKRIRLAITIILAFFALAMFGFSDVLSTYDSLNTDYQSFIKSGRDVLAMGIQGGHDDGDGDIFWLSQRVINDQEIDEEWKNWISEAANATLYPVYNMNVSFSPYLNSPRQISGQIDYSVPVGLSGVIEADTKEDYQNLGLTFVAGRRPRFSNEIVVSDYIADAFIKFGYVIDLSFDKIEILEIESYEDLIGKAIASVGYGFTLKVCGIVATGIDHKKYINAKVRDLYAFPICHTIRWDFLTSIGFVKKNGLVNKYLKIIEQMPEPNNRLICENIYFKAPSDKEAVKKLFYEAREQIRSHSRYQGKNFYMRLTVKTLHTGALMDFSSVAESCRAIFSYASIGFFVFSALLLINFITSSISAKQKEIGILRALGARSTDVYMIFLNESLIVSLICFALALSTLIVLTALLNLNAGIIVMIVGVRHIGFMALIAVGMAVLGSLLPVWRFTSKPPIETITDR